MSAALEDIDTYTPDQEELVTNMLNTCEKVYSHREMREILFRLGFDPRMKSLENMMEKLYGVTSNKTFSEYVWEIYPDP